MTFCDSHLHLRQCGTSPLFPQGETYLCVSSCHSREDVDFLGVSPISLGSCVPHLADTHFFASFGIHPQAVNSSYMEHHFAHELAFLESLLAEQKIVALGECGFDFFTAEYKSTAREQEIVFEAQLSLALRHAVPVVLHLRKSIEKIFTYSRELKKLPAVIFHSFPGTFREAQSLANHGLAAFFSFGKPLLNGKKCAIDCVANLPIQSLLLETDAPYQTLKGEISTQPEEIRRVYEQVCELRKISMGELCASIERNFRRAYLNTAVPKT